MRIFLLVSCLLISTLINAQNLEQISRSREFSEIRTNLYLDSNRNIDGKNQSNVDGSTYLFKSWNNSSKIFIGDKVYILNSFNYNIYSERFEMKLTEDSIFIVNPGRVEKILINNRIFRRYLDPEFQRNSYFEEIVKFDNDNLLLKKHILKIKQGSTNPLTKEKLTNDCLVMDETYYLCDLRDNSLKKIKLKKSVIFSLVEEDDLDDIKGFVRKHKLNYKDVDDIKKIVQYYHSL